MLIVLETLELMEEDNIRQNKVFIATSIDGYIADKEGQIDWLHSIPNPNNDDMGYANFMKNIDAIVMGKNTFNTVLGFDMDWPYQKPVFVLSTSLKEIPNHLKNVFLIKGNLQNIVKEINRKGFSSLYIDGGKTIQSFIEEDLIDEITITTIPIILGGGVKLYGKTKNQLKYKCSNTKIYLGSIVQSKFIRDNQ